MMNVNCPICGEKKFKPIFEDIGYDKHRYSIVECSACEFCYTNPQPSDSELNAIYENYYGASHETDRTKKALDFRRSVFEEICELLGGIDEGNQTLLDVGCGNGDFLFQARNRGWDVAGIEFAPPAVEYAQKVLQLNVISGSLEDLMFAANSFDAVTILDVLEHLRRPKKTLKSIHDVLKPGGKLVIRVPNTPFQILKARWLRIRHGRDFTALATPLHLNHFDERYLIKLVEAADFEVEKVLPGAADGTGFPLLVKKTYVEFARLVQRATGNNLGNILCLVARKKSKPAKLSRPSRTQEPPSLHP